MIFTHTLLKIKYVCKTNHIVHIPNDDKWMKNRFYSDTSTNLAPTSKTAGGRCWESAKIGTAPSLQMNCADPTQRTVFSSLKTKWEAILWQATSVFRPAGFYLKKVIDNLRPLWSYGFCIQKLHETDWWPLKGYLWTSAGGPILRDLTDSSKASSFASPIHPSIAQVPTSSWASSSLKLWYKEFCSLPWQHGEMVGSDWGCKKMHPWESHHHSPSLH